jgi:WD40 repeat protein
VSSLVFLQDQNTLVVSDNLAGSPVEFWDSSAGRPLNRSISGRVFRSMAVSPDRRTLALIGYETITLVDGLSGEEVGKPLVVKGASAILGGAFSPDGKILALARENNVISLWDLQKRELVREWINPGGTIQGLAFKPDAKVLLAINVEGEVSFWDSAAAELLAKYRLGDLGWRATISISADGKRLAVGSVRGIVYLWDLEKGGQSPTEISAHTDSVTGIAFSPNGRTLASVSRDKKVMLYELSGEHPKPALLGTHRTPIACLAFQNDNSLATGDESGNVSLWRVPTPNILGQSYTVGDSYLPSMAMNPDGTMLAMGYEDGSIVLWDTRTRRRVGEPLRKHVGYVYELAFSRDGLTLASGGEDGAVILWDVKAAPARGSLLFRQEGIVSALDLSPDGKILAAATYRRTSAEETSGASDFKIHLWDMPSGKPLRPALTGHKSSISRLAFSPDGSMLASGDHPNCVIMLWDTATWQAKHQLELPSVDSETKVEYGISGLSFHPNGKILAASGGHTIAFWDANSGRLEGPTRVPTYDLMATVDDVQFTGGGQFFVYSANKKIIIQDFNNRMTVGEPLIGHASPVSQLDVSASNNVMASSDFAGNLIIWQTDKASLQNLACYRANRNLSYWEWKQTFPGQPYRKTCENIPIHDSVLWAARGIEESGDVESATAVFLEAQKAEPSLPLNVAKGHFAGTWVLDISRSRGLPADLKQTMEIRETRDRIDIETKTSSVSTGENYLWTDNYILDHKEREIVPRWLDASDLKGKRRSRWTADGNGVYVTEEATGTTAKGFTKAYRKRRLIMSPDGKTLTISVYFDIAGSIPDNVRTFIRK